MSIKAKHLIHDSNLVLNRLKVTRPQAYIILELDIKKFDQGSIKSLFI